MVLYEGKVGGYLKHGAKEMKKAGMKGWTLRMLEDRRKQHQLQRKMRAAQVKDLKDQILDDGRKK